MFFNLFQIILCGFRNMDSQLNSFDLSDERFVTFSHENSPKISEKTASQTWRHFRFALESLRHSADDWKVPQSHQHAVLTFFSSFFFFFKNETEKIIDEVAQKAPSENGLELFGKPPQCDEEFYNKNAKLLHHLKQSTLLLSFM